MEFHLAQANISRFNAPLDHPSMKEFVDFLEPVNKLAEDSKGFVWRLKDEQGLSASYIKSPFKDEMMAINVSVWEDIESFKAFVYDTVHSYFLRNKKKWFDLKGPSQFVMWWIPHNQVPTVQLAKEKLSQLESKGDSPTAFSMKTLFDPQGRPLMS